MRILLFVAAVCFLLALIVASGSAVLQINWSQWVAGGLLAWVLSGLVP